MPFIEVAHTADWCLRVWSANLPSLFAEAARGMYALAGVEIASQPVQEKEFGTEGPDTESLLVAFLSNLVYLMEYERMAFDQFSVQLKSDQVSARMKGASILSITKAIKAVTFHNLKILQSDRGFEVEIVFDV
jgi:SHS2 domain-containing protein